MNCISHIIVFVVTHEIVKINKNNLDHLGIRQHYNALVKN